MIEKLKHRFALTEQGAKDLVKATAWTVVGNLTLMFPIGLLIMVLDDIIHALLTGGNPTVGVWMNTAIAAILVAVIYVVYWIEYKALYISTYTESANRRIRLGEKLRALPLSFFGQRDLSDLTATMMSDCSALEQAFSHFIPQMYAAWITAALVSIGLLVMDWRMGLAIVWVIPVSLVIVFGSRWLQDKYSKKNLLQKRAATDGLQELLETIKDIKASNQKQQYLSGLEKKLDRAEKVTIQAELITGSCITSAQAFLKLGLATTVLTGVSLLLAGQIDLTLFLIYLIAASRVYDPIHSAYADMAAVFNAEVKIDRMREIEEQPIQTGTDHYEPDGYDIVFDHVSFAYSKKDEGVLEDVSFTAKQGEVTVLVGPSGGGKSTAAKLAARFWDIDAGKISLGGVDVSTVNPETLLENYAIVFQDVVLFHDTVMENIRLGRRDATDEEVLEAARAAQCDAFVKKLLSYDDRRKRRNIVWR